MRIVKLSSAQFDRFAATHKYRNYFQTSMYASVMTKFGYNASFLGIVSDDEKLIGATLIIYKDIFMGNKIAYAPHGILFDFDNANNVKELVKELKKTLGKQGIMLFRMDPYIPLAIYDSNGNTMNINTKGDTIINNIVASGFKYKGKNLFFETEKPRFEALVLLQKSIDDIYAKTDKRIKNKIRKASNSGIEIVKEDDVKPLLSLLSNKDSNPKSYYQAIYNNYKSNIDIYYAKVNTEKFLINSRRSYEKEMEYNEQLASQIQDVNLDYNTRETYLNKKMESDKLITSYKNNLLKATDLLKSNPDGIVIAGAMILKYDNAAYIICEGLDNNYSNICANYLLKWQLINDYNNAGLKYINLNAIVGEFNESNEYSGLNESKLGFNSTATEYIGEFDIILNSFAYGLYKKVNKDN